jgi:RNA polymerase sporulation-specific sigma factor
MGRKTIKNNDEIYGLIDLVISGDSNAFSTLVEKYNPMLKKILAFYSTEEMSNEDVEDLSQEELIAFYRAIINFDREQDEVEFGLYAKICVNNALISQIRKLGKKSAEQFLDSAEREDSAIAEEPSQKIIEIESFERLDAVIRANLSQLEYRVWYRYASGLTARDIGKALGKSEKSVSNAIYRIRKKLRQLLG